MPKPKKPPFPETPSPQIQPLPPNGPGKNVVGLTPWTVLRAAVKAVPALKYALGVLGIVSAIAIIKGFGIDFRVAAFGTIIMMVLMAALVVFAALTKVKSPQVRTAALVMMWSFLAVTILSAALLFTSAFFDYPKPLTRLLGLVGPSSHGSDSSEVIKRLDAEIAHRLREIPNRLKLSRSNTTPVAKGNLLSGVFDIVEGDWQTPLFPEFAKRSVISLCYDLKDLSSGSDRDTAEAAYQVFQEMAKASREKYYVQDMYKMSLDRLKSAEDEAEQYYNRAIRVRPQWAAR